ncbi:MAG: CopD family protein [Myxococcota bacterium]
MNLVLVGKFIHVVGLILWFGGLIFASVLLLRLGSAQRSSVLQVVRSTFLRVVSPGVLLAWVGGLLMFAVNLSLYLRAGWMHGKLTLALLAAGLTGAISALLRKASKELATASPDEQSSAESALQATSTGSSSSDGAMKKLRMLAILVVLMAVLSLGLVVFRPGGR